LARRLRVPSPDPAEDALARATLLQQASKAGFVALHEAEEEDPHDVVAAIRTRVEQRNFAAWEQLGPNLEEETPSEQYTRLRRRMIDAERARVLEIRSAGDVASDVVAEVLVMLDVEESMLDAAARSRAELRSAATGERSRRVVECEDLARLPAVDTTEDPQCTTCLAEGTRWVHLRQCLVCGRVGCCDSSPGRHASAHFRETGHPVMQSAEPGERWRWCFVHHVTG
jgi:monovalent cation/hydrogen antiporter